MPELTPEQLEAIRRQFVLSDPRLADLIQKTTEPAE